MQRMKLKTRRGRRRPSDTRRFEHAERMQVVSADFTHFRAGPTRCKRLALYVLDDASRYGLDGSVHTGGEDNDAFLHATARVLRRYGRFDAMYVDHGPAFIADDLARVLANLNIALILGRVRYPQGRGKIERFNRSAKARLLRSLAGADVDPSPESLTLRVRYDLERVYNQRPHSALGGQSPAERWQSGRPLRPIDEQELVAAFTLPVERTVSADHVISYEGTLFEVPCGYSRQRVILHRRLLEDDALYIEHHGRLVRLHPVNTTANSHAVRARTPNPPDDSGSPPPSTASTMRFANTFAPMVDAEGGYAGPDAEPTTDEDDE